MRHVPNFLSILRILLALPVVLAIRSGAVESAFLLLLAAVLTDAADGILARRLGAQTETGRVLDPLADKLLAASVAWALWEWRDLPGWFLVAVLVRDLLLLAGGFAVARLTGRVPESTLSGKIAFAAVAAALLVHLAAARRLSGLSLAVATPLLALSLADYARLSLRFLGARRGPGSGP